jgi:hypothetical protein
MDYETARSVMWDFYRGEAMVLTRFLLRLKDSLFIPEDIDSRDDHAPGANSRQIEDKLAKMWLA